VASPSERRTPTVSGRIVMRRKPLDTAMLRAWRGAEIEVALAALKRIRAYWTATTSHPWFAFVLDDDQGLDQTLTHDLFFALRQRPDLGVVTAEIRKLVPEMPVDHDLAIALDEDIKGDIYDQLSRARFILNEVLIAEGGSFGPNRADSLFDHFDKELDFMVNEAKRQAEAAAIRLGLKAPPPTSKPPEATKSPPTTGRHQLRARDRRERARELREKGLARKEIAKQLGITERYVYVLLADQSDAKPSS
jgi:hypothetical protein